MSCKMKHFFNRSLISTLVTTTMLWASGCGKKPEAQPTCGFVQNSEGQRVSWKGNSQVKLYYDTSVPTEIYPHIQAAVDSWNLSIGRTLFVIVGAGSGGGSARQDGSSFIYWMYDWDQTKVNKEQARTDIYWVNDQMIEADLSFNARGFNIRPQTAGGPKDVDARSLVLHEMGHALGMAHNNTHLAVMNETLASNQERRDPTHSDIENLRCEYK